MVLSLAKNVVEYQFEKDKNRIKSHQITGVTEISFCPSVEKLLQRLSLSRNYLARNCPLTFRTL